MQTYDDENPPALASFDSGEDDDSSRDDEYISGNEIAKRVVVAQPNSTTPSNGPTRLDKFLVNYGSFSGSTYYAEQGIKILQYTSWAISYASRDNHENLSEMLYKLSYEVGMSRYVLRFYGFLQTVEGCRSGSWASGDWDNPQIASIAKYLMCGSMLFYYPLELIVYAGWRELIADVDANKYFSMSCICWALYIIADAYVSCLKKNEISKKLKVFRKKLTKRKKQDDKEAVVSTLIVLSIRIFDADSTLK